MFVCAVDGSGEFTGGPALKFLNGSLPSNALQSHDYVHYAGEVVNPSESIPHSNTGIKSLIFHSHSTAVTSLNVLPPCKFTAVYARPCKVKPLQGGKQVFESRVYPDDHTVPRNSTSVGFKDKFLGSTIITQDVSWCLLMRGSEWKSEHETIDRHGCCEGGEGRAISPGLGLR